MDEPHDNKLTISVTKITGYIPPVEEGPFKAFPVAPIGSLFHDLCSVFLADLNSKSDFQDTVKRAVADVKGPKDAEGLEAAVQAMKDYVFDELLRKAAFSNFHDLEAHAQMELWRVLESFLEELGLILFAAKEKGEGLSSVLLGSEQPLYWLTEIKGRPIVVSGRYDLLLYDHRYDTPHLIDFKLCGVKRDLASLIQVMLYALMLNKNHGIRPAATVLNLYPQRSPITVAWPHIMAFEKPLLTFIEYVAGKEYPGSFSPVEIPNPTAELIPGNTPFETPELLVEAQDLLARIKDKLSEFNLPVEPYEEQGGAVLIGPTFITLRVTPGKGVKVASLTNRIADLQIALATSKAPRVKHGAGYVCIEVPRQERSVISLSEILERNVKPGPHAFVLGVDVTGTVHWGDFSKPPTCHLLVAGQTGSGKSEFVRQLLCSLAFGSSPHGLQMVVVDPKITGYQDLNDSPFLRCHVIDRMDEAVEVLKSLVEEMENRYLKFRVLTAKDLESYNARSGLGKIPRIVVAFDEFADAMADKELKKQLESSVKRLGAKARAAGIHLIIATQSPRKEVVTGLIKANLPCVTALAVAGTTESLVVLDRKGAETLLGNGDLLTKVGGEVERLQSPLADAQTVRRIMFPGV